MQPESTAPKPRVIREIDFGVISEGFNLIWRNLGPFLVVSVVYWAVTVLLGQVFSFATKPLLGPEPTAGSDMSEIFAYANKSYVFQGPFSIILGMLLAPLNVSVCRMTLKLNRGEKIDVSDGFTGFEAFGAAAVAYLLISIASTVGLLGCIIGSAFVYGLLMFTFPLIADKKMAPVPALMESFSMLKKHWLMAGLFAIVLILCTFLGFLACCIGILVTWPLLQVCATLVYRDFTIGRGAPAPVQPAPSGDA